MEINENAITFDYKTIKVKREMETIICDTYENLGWELTSSNSSEGSPFYVNLSFKRNRKIAKKVELLKLQEKVDSILANIENIQQKKKTAGVPEGITIGVIGTLVFGGGLSMAMVLQSVSYIIGGSILGLVGISIGFLGWFVHNKIKKKKVHKLQPILESEFDKLSDICEEANKMIK